MMILGLVAAKDKSNRFVGKNKHIHHGRPLFWHSVEPLLESEKVDEVYVITDSDYIKSYCEERNVGVIWRPKNATRAEDKLINILRFGYYNLNKEYDIVVSLMANCPGHSTNVINDGINLLQNKKLREVRSFNKDGDESGLLIFSKEILQNNFDISYYIGGLTSDVKEIHYKEGKKHGTYSMWFENGQIQNRGSYIMGKANGKWIIWHENGVKFVERNYINGIESLSQTIWWDDEGNLIE